jgi:hypothetical protein
MTDDDPPPNVDRRPSNGIDPAVQAFLEAMESTDPGTVPIDSVGRKLYSYKVSLYLSVDDPNVPNAVRTAFAKWLNELSKFPDLKSPNLKVTNCDDDPLLVPSLLYDDGFKQLTGWELVNSRKFKNVYLCVKMQASTPFSRLKFRMKTFLHATNIHMKRNHSLGDSSEEMVTIGYLSPVHPELSLDHLQTELNNEIQCINAQKDDDFLADYGIHRGVRGELVIAHGAVRGTSKQHGDVVNSKAVVVECPKSKSGYYVQTVQEALRIFGWSPDLKKVKFVPFALKANSKTKDIFTNMIVYNSLENHKKAYAQVLGVSRDNMLEVRDRLIEECPVITHIDPTQLTEKQGRWRIYTSTDKLDFVEKWLTAHLARLVNSLAMCIPVPGFDTPRLVVSNRISSLHVQEIAAIATTVPTLDDTSAFPNLVIRHSRRAKQGGAWSNRPRVVPHVVAAPSVTPNSPVITLPGGTQLDPHPVPPLPTSPVLMNLARQLDENREYRRKLDISRAKEKEENKEFRATLSELRLLIEQEMTSTTAILESLTAGQIDLQHSMASQAEHHTEEISGLRAELAQLNESVRALLRASSPLSTPPRLLRADSDPPVSSASDSDASLTSTQKRSPDRDPSKQNPRVTKLYRTAENMETDEDDTSAIQSSIRQP